MKTLKLGILGCAKINGAAIFSVVPHIPGVVVGGIAARDVERARQTAQQHNIEKYYGDYSALISDPDIDAIYNPLPNSLHCEWSIKAVEAGKPVLCEKPIAANAEEAARMADAARACATPIVEAFHNRCHPAIRRLEAIMRSGVLGAPLTIEARFKTPVHLLPPDNIRFQYALAGGAILDPGCYCINAVRMVAGEEPRVISASARVPAPDIDTAMYAELAFPSGCRAVVDCSLGDDIEGFDQSLTITGEKGRIDVSNPFLPHLGCTLRLSIAGEEKIETFTDEPTYLFQLREFADLVRTGKFSDTSIDNGVKNMRVIDDIYRAAGMRIRGL